MGLASRLTRPGALALVALLAPLAATFWGAHQARERAAQRRQERFERATEQIAGAVEARLRAYEQLLRGCASLFAASESVGRADWAAYVSGLGVASAYPGVRALAYVSRLTDEEVPAFEKAARAQGLAVTVRPPSHRPERLVITYIEPMATNASAVGFDIGSEARRRAAAEKSRDEGRAALSERVALVQDAEAQPAFLLFLPVFPPRAQVETVDQRRRHLRGWVFAAARTGELMGGLPLRSSEMDVELFDGTTPDAAHAIFDAVRPLQPAEPGPGVLWRLTPLSVPGRQWTLRVTALPAFEAAGDSLEVKAVILGGGLASVLLGGFVWSLASTRRRAIDRADEMTRALRASERHMRAVLDTVPDAILTFDGSGSVTSANRAAERMFGTEARHLVGRRFSSLVEGASEGPEERKEAQALRADGTVLPVDLAVTRMEDGATLVAILRDVTERLAGEQALRASEQRTRSILQNMLGGLITIDEAGAIESVNPAAEAIFGYPAAELVGQHLEMLVPETVGDRRAYLRQAFARAIGRASEWQGRRKNGETFPFELSMFEFRTGGGRHFAGNVRDLSERREVEKLKQEFVSTVSHELRTPLASIRGSLSLLAGGVLGDLSDEAREMVALADRNCARLITLVNDILDLERVKQGRLQMEFLDVPLADVLVRAREAVQEFAGQRNVSLEVASPASTVRGDHGRLVQVLVNLVSNAVKFSPAGSTVKVLAREARGRARVEVVDQGRGVPAAQRKAIFERFKQVESSDAREKGGTGLGLAICKSILEAHGGEIGVESEEGKGSTFWFEVPLASPDNLLENFRRANGRPDVLLADGDEALLSVLIRQLTAAGVRVRAATSGAEAARAVHEAAPRLLVVDLGLPGGEGRRLLESLRTDERLSLLPLLVYSAEDIEERVQARLVRGPTRFLTKSRATDAQVRAVILGMLEAEAREAHT